ncbi:MAG: hypothetical protein ACRYFR_11795 [Janthinobacterium lividum]
MLFNSKAQNPNVLFVLGVPFAYPVGQCQEHWEQWRNAVARQQDVVRKLAAEFDAMVVDYPAVLDQAAARQRIEYWFWDGIHPTASRIDGARVAQAGEPSPRLSAQI